MQPSDADLVRQCLRGDNRGFDRLVDKYERQVRGFCYRIVGDPDRADDAAQDTFVKAYHALEGFRADAKFLSWLFKIAGNTCIDMNRAAARRGTETLDEIDPARASVTDEEMLPEPAAMRSESDRVVQNAVLGLPIKYRMPLVMFHFNEMSIGEISQSLGRPEGTIKSDLHVARENLRRKLEGVVIEV